MKRKIILVLSILTLLVVGSTMLFACSSSGSYDKMEAYYAEKVADVKKCESTLDSLMSTIEASSFVANFTLERTYYSTADNNITFLGSRDVKGYNGNSKEDGTKWMKSAVDYEFSYNSGNYKIVAKVYAPVASDDYDAKNKGEAVNTYTYTYINGVVVTLGGTEAEVTACCVDKMYDIIFGQFTSDAFLEAYAIEATHGFRFVTHMMQYQTARAFKYALDGTIDLTNVINYTENKDKTVYTDIEEELDGEKLSDAYEAKMRGEDVSYWAAFGEDISYNLYKVAAIYNDRVTMTYKKKTSQIETYEYYGERVLPFYTKKSDFKTYNVLKAVVADYTHFTAEFEYKDVEIA